MKNIIDYLETKVDGKTLYTEELLYDLDGGALQGVYSDQMSFSNLKYSQSGLQLDMFLVSNEKIYYVGEEKKQRELRKDFSAVSLFRFELAKRKSTGEITGLFRFLSASGKDIPAEAVVSGIYDVHITDDILVFKEDQVLYRDQPARDDRYKAVSFQSEQRFFIRDDKLHYEYDGKSFDVDTATLKQMESADRFPPFRAVER